MNKLIEMKKDILIQWIASLSDPDFSSIKSLSSLNSGFILAKLINTILYNSENKALSLIQFTNKYETSIANINSCLFALKQYDDNIPKNINQMTPIEFYQRDQAKIDIIEFLYNKTTENLNNKTIITEETQTKSFNIDSFHLKAKSKTLKIKNNRSISSHKPMENTNEITLQTKQKIINWFLSIGLIKQNIDNLIEKLPKICKNGLIFIDLINRVSGKIDVIKGINRDPQSIQQIDSNFKKLYDYLKQFDKLNPRYLWISAISYQTNENNFWNFLDDIWYLYNKKISPYDKRYINNNSHMQLKISPIKINQKIENNKLEIDQSRIEIKNINDSSFELKNNQTKSLIFDDKPKGYSQIHIKEKTPNKNLNKSIILKEITKNYTPKENKNLGKSICEQEKFNLTKEIREEINQWLNDIGFKQLNLEKNLDFLLDDPMRNGILFCLILKKLGFEIEENIKNPVKSISECVYNFDLGNKAMKRNKFFIPNSYFNDIEEIIMGKDNIIYGILYYLKKYNKNSDYENNENKYFEDTNNIPYTRTEIIKLEENLLMWIRDLGIEINEIYYDARICDIIYQLTLKLNKMRNNFIYNDKRKLNKALEILRDNKFIGRKFLWKEREIYNGDKICIIGILEDLFRLFNDKPGRKGKENYFIDGPCYSWMNSIKNNKCNSLNNKIYEKKGVFSLLE